MNLDDPITKVPGIGPKYTRLLANLNIKSVEDLLLHIPYRYEDRSNICKISEIVANEPSTVVGTITKIENIFTQNRKRLTKARIHDESGEMDIIWFNQHYLKRLLPTGTKIAIYGTLDQRTPKPQFVSPKWEIIKEQPQTGHTVGLVPIYSTTGGITSKWIRAKIKQVLQKIQIDEFLPERILFEYDLPARDKAIFQVHSPDTINEAQAARLRLSFEEFLLIHLNGMKLRKEWNKKKNSHKIALDKKVLDAFRKSLPYTLTSSQDKTINEILKDLKENIPMNRLLQGDVGSGKTVVATVALLAAAKSGFNSLYMAPTQMLAQQHFETIRKLLRKFRVDVQLITGGNTQKIPGAKKTSDLTIPRAFSALDLANITKARVIIGTHAILHHMERFQNIGLIIIDEQHKFGVKQRTEIVKHYTDKLTPNLLTMTATPIPRSLALTFYGDLDLSVIDELPKGRKLVKTWVIQESKRHSAYDWIKNQITSHHIQVFIVCPFIEESTHGNLQNVKAAEAEFLKLKKYFKTFKLGLLHGRLKPTEKDQIIQKFANKEIQILVSTPVIEVGIDIPNANIILIETPERFGLASLHQLRGRVGRSEKQAYCILLPSTDSYQSIKRLKNMEKIHNGNKLAEIDLKIRGPGNIYGTQQHGFLDLRIANATDIELIRKTKQVATNIFQNLNCYSKIKEKVDKMEYIGEN